MIKPDHAREEAYITELMHIFRGTRKGFCITERATAYSTQSKGEKDTDWEQESAADAVGAGWYCLTGNEGDFKWDGN